MGKKIYSKTLFVVLLTLLMITSVFVIRVRAEDTFQIIDFYQVSFQPKFILVVKNNSRQTIKPKVMINYTTNLKKENFEFIVAPINPYETKEIETVLESKQNMLNLSSFEIQIIDIETNKTLAKKSKLFTNGKGSLMKNDLLILASLVVGGLVVIGKII